MSDLFFPAIYNGAPAAARSEAAGGARRMERVVRIPTGLNLGIPWQWGGDVRAMRAILGDPGYYDWHWVTGGDNYQRMIYSRIDERDWRTIQQLIRRDPSHLWLVMNEPERRDQANLSPADGADLAKLMRLAGACIAVPGVIITVEGLDWLDDYLSAGGPVPEAWHVHLYFAETAAGMDRRLETWGDWMESAALCARRSSASSTHKGRRWPVRWP